MSNLSMKRVAADTIANYLQANVAGLAASAVSAGPDQTGVACPSVKVLPGPFPFEPAQADEVYENATDDGKVIVDVGSFTGLFTLQLYATSPAEREKYEQAILDLFLKTEWAPGTIFVTTPNLIVNGYSSLYQAELKARLDSEDWNEELAFEAKRYSFIEIYVDYPALTTYDAANITSLQLALSDMDSIVTVVTDISPGDRVDVQEDGTVKPGTL